MTYPNNNKFLRRLLILLCLAGNVAVVPSSFAQAPKPIVIEEPEGDILKRMQRAITLDVRDMNIVDVIKFLALKGEFNVVISPTVSGRVTVLLNSVTIQDSLDIVIIANNLAYKIQGNIIQVMSS